MPKSVRRAAQDGEACNLWAPPRPSRAPPGPSEQSPSRTESGEPEFKFRVEAANAAASRVGPGRPQGTNPRGLSIPWLACIHSFA